MRPVQVSPQVVCSKAMRQKGPSPRSSQPNLLAIPTEELEGVWGTIGEAGSATRVRSSGTIVPLDSSELSLSQAIRDKLPRYSLKADDARPLHLDIGQVIGCLLYTSDAADE